MNRTSIFAVLAGLLVAAHAEAQTYHASPADLLNTEGADTTRSFGGYASARFMLIDGELRNKPGVIQNIAMRANFANHTTFGALGRSWTNVTIDIASSDFTARSTVFARNVKNTPTRVFDGRIAWPTMLGSPSSQPAPFGGPTGTLQYPLSQGYVVTGTDDLSLDIRFSGGVLADPSRNWGSSLTVYPLDSYGPTPTSAFGREQRHGRSLQAGGCVGPGSYNGWGGHAQLASTTFSRSSSTRPGKVFLSASTLMTEPNQLIIQAYGVGGSPTGVPFPGVTCNQLHIDLAQPVILISQTPSGQFALASQTFEFDYQSFMANLPIWMQAAWTDQNTGQLLLTSASQNYIAPRPNDRLRSCVWSASPGATSGTLVDTADVNPVLRYTY